jgi:hypothetical protein
MKKYGLPHTPRTPQKPVQMGLSEEEYQQESKRLEAAIAKAKAHLKEPCALAEKIERKAAVRDAEESLRQHKLDYFELVDLSQRRSEAMQVTVFDNKG